MKVKTRDGEVELTPEMVCRGMVFRDAANKLFTTGGKRWDDVWYCVFDATTFGVPHRFPHFLGCDPTIATRADCERYGVHGDAAVHGFARARDGGALDLERDAPEGAVYEHVSGGARRVTGAAVPFTDKMRFVGLDARHASPDNVKRLCCYEPDTSERRDGFSALPRWQDVAWREAPRRRCTLAIGDHAEHEDIATGVKWHRQAERMSDAYLKYRAEEWLRSGAKPLQCRKTPEEMADWNRHAEEAERLRGYGGEVPRLLVGVTYRAVRAWLMACGYVASPDSEIGYERFNRGGHSMRLLADNGLHETRLGVRFFAAEMGRDEATICAELTRAAIGLGATDFLAWCMRLWDDSQPPNPAQGAVTRADVTLAPCGHPVVTMVDDSGEHPFHLTEAIAEGLARSIGDVLQFPWTNRESVSQRCPRHPDLLIGCGCTCTACAQESGAESLPDLCLDFAIKAKDYLRTREPALAEEARSLHARISAIMPESDARRGPLDTLLRTMAEAPPRVMVKVEREWSE